MFRRALQRLTFSTGSEHSSSTDAELRSENLTALTMPATHLQPTSIEPSPPFTDSGPPHNGPLLDSFIQGEGSKAHSVAQSSSEPISSARPIPTASSHDVDNAWDGTMLNHASQTPNNLSWTSANFATHESRSAQPHAMSSAAFPTMVPGSFKNTGTKPPPERAGVEINLSVVDQKRLEIYPTEFETNAWLKAVMCRAAGKFLYIQTFYRHKSKLYFITDTDEEARQVLLALRLGGFPMELGFSEHTTVHGLLQPLFMFAIHNIPSIPGLDYPELLLRYKGAFQSSYPNRVVLPRYHRSPNRLLVQVPNIDDTKYFYELATVGGNVRLDGTEFPIRAWSHARESRQCYTCFTPFHTSKGNAQKGLGRCTNTRCPHCAGQHRANQCPGPWQTVCCVCGGTDHKATHWRSCPDPRMQQMAKEIEQAMNTPPQWVKSLGLDLLPTGNPSPAKKTLNRKRKADVNEGSQSSSGTSLAAGPATTPDAQGHISEQIGLVDSLPASGERHLVPDLSNENSVGACLPSSHSVPQQRQPLSQLPQSVVNTQAQRQLHPSPHSQAIPSSKWPQEQTILISSSPPAPNTPQNSSTAPLLSTPATNRTTDTIDLESRLQLSSGGSSNYGSSPSLTSSDLQELNIPPPDPELYPEGTRKAQRVAFNLPAVSESVHPERAAKRKKIQHPSEETPPSPEVAEAGPSETSLSPRLRRSTRSDTRKTYSFAPSLKPTS